MCHSLETKTRTAGDKEKASTNWFPNTASSSLCAAPVVSKVLLSQGKLQEVPVVIYLQLT